MNKKSVKIISTITLIIFIVNLYLGVICNGVTIKAESKSMVDKSVKLIDEKDNRYRVTLKVPGQEIKPVEYILLLDTSSSVTKNYWPQTQEIIEGFGDRLLATKEQKNSLTIMNYAFGSAVTPFSPIKNIEELDKLRGNLTVENIAYGVSASNLEAGLDNVRTYINNQKDENKDYSVIVLTDGEGNLSNGPEKWQNWMDEVNKNWNAGYASIQELVEDIFPTIYTNGILKGNIDSATREIGYSYENLKNIAIVKEMVEAKIAEINALSETEKEKNKNVLLMLKNILARFDSNGNYVWGNTTIEEEKYIQDKLIKEWCLNDLKTEVSGTCIRTGIVGIYTKGYLWMEKMWANAYKEEGLTYDSVTEYKLNDVHSAILNYDIKYFNAKRGNSSTFCLIWSLYQSMCKHSVNTKPNSIALAKEKAKIALESLIGNVDVTVVDFSSAGSWLENYEDKVYYHNVSSYNNIVGMLDDIVDEFDKTSYKDVAITDYTSKWVELDTKSIKIYDDKAGKLIYDISQDGGWLIPESERKIKTKNPIELTEITDESSNINDIELDKNTNGSIHKIVWNVKDGPLYASDMYRLEYEVSIDMLEDGFQYNMDLPINTKTSVAYMNVNNEKVTQEIGSLNIEVKKEEPPEEEKDPNNEEDTKDDGNDGIVDNTIDSIEDTDDSGDTIKKEDVKHPKNEIAIDTGDTNKITMYIILLILSFAISCGLIFYKKR